MRINAYILAADPNWIEHSVQSYYDIIDKLVICYDEKGKGWTGAPIAAVECIDRVLAIDYAKKVKILGGTFYRPSFTPMENDTYQRQYALAEAGKDADWVIELDTDEVMPDANYFLQKLLKVTANFAACMWPMRVMFKQTGVNRFLEVSTRTRKQYSEYPGPVACRPGIMLTAARRTESPCFLFRIRYSIYDWLRNMKYDRDSIIESSKAILHFSWARPENEILLKLHSWGHSKDFDTGSYLNEVWRPADSQWRELRNFHPVWPNVWPALREVELPSELFPKLQ